MQDAESRIDGYVLGRTIGGGSTCKTKLAYGEDGKEYALKIFCLDDPKFNAEEF